MSTREQVNKISSVTLENIYKNPAYKALISQFKNRGISLCNQELEDIAWLLLISHKLGINRSCVQASGGNTSLKIQGFILIKASGKKLKDCLEENIFILIKKEDFNEEELTITSPKDIFGTNLRPSIETAFHCLDKQKFVIHTHPIEIIRATLAENMLEASIRRIKEYKPKTIEYKRPGYELAKAIKDERSEERNSCYILKNHGLVYGCQKGSQALSIHNNIVDAFKTKEAKENCTFNDKELNELIPKLKSVGINATLPKSPLVHQIAMNESINRRMKTVSIVPDAVVFLGNKNVFLDQLPKSLDKMTQTTKSAKFISIKEAGVIIISDNESRRDLIEEFLEMHIQILLPLASDSKITGLNKKEVNDLLDWEAEKYRVAMLK